MLKRTLVLYTLCIAALTGFFHWRLDEVQGRIESTERESVRKADAERVGRLHEESTHETLDGGSLRIGPSSQGTLVLFFLPGCPGCRAAASSWNQLCAEARAAGLECVGVASDVNGASEFALEFGLEFPIALDRSAELAREFGVKSFPERVLLDRHGRVAMREEALGVLTNQRSDLGRAARAWPDGLRESFLLQAAASVLPGVTAVEEFPMRANGASRFVLQREGQWIGFGAILSRDSWGWESSPLDCLVILDRAGMYLGAVPLREHRSLGHAIGRAEFDAWSKPAPIRRSTPELERVFRAELGELLSEFGFDRPIDGIELGDA